LVEVDNDSVKKMGNGGTSLCRREGTITPRNWSKLSNSMCMSKGSFSGVRPGCLIKRLRKERSNISGLKMQNRGEAYN